MFTRRCEYTCFGRTASHICVLFSLLLSVPFRLECPSVALLPLIPPRAHTHTHTERTKHLHMWSCPWYGYCHHRPRPLSTSLALVANRVSFNCRSACCLCPRQCGINQCETGSQWILHANLYALNLELKPGAFGDRRGVFGASTWAETSRE